MKDGYINVCRECINKIRRDIYIEDKIRINERRSKYDKEHPKQKWVSSTLKNHRQNKFTVNISFKELITIAENSVTCPLCGTKLDWDTGKKCAKSNSPSLDRKDNGNELNINNTWIICWGCNRGKYNWSIEEYIEHCKKVAGVA